MCMARHPSQDLVAYGGENGTPRIYRISDNQQRTAAYNDTNLVRAFERQPSPIPSIAYSPDGERIAVGTLEGKVLIYDTGDGKRLMTLEGHEGGVFSIDYRPGGKQLATGGFDGSVRIFDAESGELAVSFSPVPIITDEMFVEALTLF